MRQMRLLLLGGIVSAVLLLAKTTIDYDHTVNFGRYHTYSWITVSVQDPLWTDRIKNAIDNQLAAKGWNCVDSGGEASIAAFGATHEERTLETWYGGGFGGGWYHRGWWVGGGPGYATTTIDRVPIGTLHVDIFDARTKRVIWHGDSSQTLTGNAKKNQKKMEKDVADLFKKFPPTAKD